MYEPSIVAALKIGFRDPRRYYDALQSFGGAQGSFFDKYLGGHVVVGYHECQEIYRNTSAFGRSRLSFPPEYLAGCEQRRVAEGYRILQAMSVFQNADASYAPRRQRLLSVLGAAKQSLASGTVKRLATGHIEETPAGQEVDLFSSSLRRYAAQCANVALFGETWAPDGITASATTAANFLDGKRPARAHVLDALDAFDRLGDWIAARLGISRTGEHELVADLVLLYVAAHESMAYLLYTCLVRLAREEHSTRLRSREALAAFVAEALRYDSPVQMSGRVALRDVVSGDVTFHAGDKVYLHVGAANRDGCAFETPHEFIERRTLPHLAFGWGPTRCVGSEYAATCVYEYLGALLSCFEQVRHRPEATIFDHGFSARGLKAAFFTCA